MRIFSCPVYIHVPKDKRKKLEPLGKKGIFVGYSESSKTYTIYVPGQKQVEVNRDVTLDENVAYWKSKEVPMDSDEDEEHEAPKEEGSCPSNSSEHVVDHQEPEGPSDPVEPVVVLEIKKGQPVLDPLSGNRRTCSTSWHLQQK